MAAMPALPTDCHLCGDPITTATSSARFGLERDLWSFTWDHVVPRSLGGGNEEGNLRPAHLACNIRRKNTPMDEWVASRRWETPIVSARTFEHPPRPCIQCGDMIDTPRAMQVLHRGECTVQRARHLARQRYAARQGAQQRFGGRR